MMSWKRPLSPKVTSSFNYKRVPIKEKSIIEIFSGSRYSS
jgi:hypothetical protein